MRREVVQTGRSLRLLHLPLGRPAPALGYEGGRAITTPGQDREEILTVRRGGRQLDAREPSSDEIGAADLSWQRFKGMPRRQQALKIRAQEALEMPTMRDGRSGA